jgi:hypothetical protein
MTMKTIFASASALAVVALLSTGASASEARHNDLLVGKATVEQSTTGNFQALGQASYNGNVVTKQGAADPARGSFSGE